MEYIVLFEDNDEKAAVRTALMPLHLAFLERHSSMILAAGPLADAVTGAPRGGAWRVRAADRDAVMSLVEQDPFWPTGLRRSVDVVAWRLVYADGARQAGIMGPQGG